MKQASYIDDDGRKWAVWLEDDMQDSDACMGLPLGPPSLEALDLPLAVEVRLHNELFDRRIFTLTDAQRRSPELFAAVQAAYRVDTARILEAYSATSA